MGRLIGWIRVFAAAGEIIVIVSAIYVYTKIRASRRNKPMSFISWLTYFEGTKDDFIFGALVIVGVILGNIAVRLN
jgi:hypothetical protein